MLYFLKTPKENYEIRKERKTLLTVASVVFDFFCIAALLLPDKILYVDYAIYIT